MKYTLLLEEHIHITYYSRDKGLIFKIYKVLSKFNNKNQINNFIQNKMDIYEQKIF